MAIYHCSIKIIGKSEGKSAVASSAYRSSEKLTDDRTGLIHDFTKSVVWYLHKFHFRHTHRRNTLTGMCCGMRWKRQRRNPMHSLQKQKH